MTERHASGLPPVRRRRAVVAGCAALLAAAGCDTGDAPDGATAGGGETPAALILVEGLDDEGIVTRALLSDTGLAAFFRDAHAFADAAPLVDYLDPGARVDAAAGTLTLDGVDSGIALEVRNGRAYVPVRPLADRYRAFARIEPTPGRAVTVWRHDVLCTYAQGADRRAEVFIGAAEQGLLSDCRPPIDVQVRRWASAAPDERWAASVTLAEPLAPGDAAALLERFGAAPYAAYGVVAGHHLIARVSADSASPVVLDQLDAAAIDALERTLCGLPGALERRSGAPVARRHTPGEDAFHGERHMLAAALAARGELPRVRAGAPIVFGADVIAAASDLRRLAADPGVARFDPATRVDHAWVLPGVDLGRAPGLETPADVAALDSAGLFDRLAAEAARAATDCQNPPGR